MKVLLFSLGVTEYAVSLVNALTLLNVEVIFVTSERSFHSFSKKYVSKEVNVFYLDFSGRPFHPKNLRALRDFVRIVNNEKPDIIHIQGHGHDLFFLTLPFIIQIPVINTIHDIERHVGEERFISKFKALLSAYFCSRNIVHGQALKRNLLNKNFTSYKSSCIDVIPVACGGTLKPWSQSVISEEPNTILFFGRMRRYKGLNILIKSEPFISKYVSDLKIILAGSGKEMERYPSLFSNRERYEIINKHIPFEEVPELFQRSTVVVLPYIEASQSGVVPIAYAYGKPVIVTDVGSLNEVVKNGITGIVVKPNDVKGFATAVVKFLNDKTFRINTSGNAYKMGKEIFSSEKIAIMTVSSYNKVLQNKK